MQTHVAALIVVIVNIGCTRVAVCEGPWCYDCVKAVKPASCGEIIKCKDDEQCYASSTGVSPTQYTAGCRKKQLCQGTGSVSGGSSPHGCEECCIGDHCNSKLCGGLPVPMGGSRLCLQCEAVLHPSQCSTVSKCGQDKYCSIWKRYKFQMTFYDLGCLEKTECDGHMKGEDQLSYGGVICCNDDFCNSHENNNHLTPAPTETAATTSQPVTTIRTGNLLCKTCASIQHPRFCQSETQCGPDQYCSVRRVFRFGLSFYSLGCEEKTECEDHMTTLGEGGFRCCNEDRCNANVNPVTGTTTPIITIPASPETSSVPTTTSSLPPSTTIRTGTLICKTCEIVQQPTFCQRETECGPEQYCSVRRVFKFGIIFYELGCEEKTACEDHMTTLGEAGFRCCNEDRCNANVNPKKPSSLTPMAPDIMNTNQTVNVIAGKTVLLLCNVTGNPEPSVTWTYDKQMSPNAHPKGSTLAISSVNVKNEGQYRCVANNALGTMEGVIHLHVIEPVFVKVEPPIVVISPGMSGVRLKCVGEGIPAPEVTLSRLGGDITADRFYGHVNPAEILLVRITEANMLTYDGVYVCNATNGHTSASAYQIVAGNITRMLGENIAFNNISTTPLKAFHALCPPGQTQTDASPTTTEFDLGELICTSARKVGLIDTDAGSVTWLIRPDGKAQFLNGSMSVDLEQVNTSTTPATLVSSATTSSPLLAPDILNTNQTVNAILGETVLLFCNVTGNPTPSVTWEYDNSENPNAHPKGSTLAISSVNEKNKGIYRCVANNTQGTKEGIVHLHVTEPVSVKGEPPIVVISPGMRIARLKCVGEGIPPPSVTLSKYGEDITADKLYKHLGPAEILLMGITEANVLRYDGVYVCNATNGDTSDSAYQIVASNVTRILEGNVPFNNISTTPLKAFHAVCPPGHTQPDASPITTEFHLGELICTSARNVGLLHTDAGTITWLIRPDGKAQFLNGSLSVDLDHVTSTAVPLTSAFPASLAISAATSPLPLMAPDISNTNQTVNAILGETVLLFCNVSGNPTPFVTWEYDKSFSPNAHPKGSTLAISSVNEKNEGIYRCVANNTLGTKEGVVNLHVTEPVSVKGEPPIVVISPGMRALRLKCVGEGIPPPSVTLSKYDEDITADKSYRYLGPAEILIMGITEANVLKYDGVYVCNATNGDTSASAYQIVASNVTRTLGENVTFNNVSTTPLKAFHALCPPGLTGPDGSPVTHEFNLDEAICTSARMVGLIDRNPGLVTWFIRPDGKAQFLNGSLNVDIGQANSTSVITTPSTSASSSAQVSSTESTMLPLSLSMQPSTLSNIQNTGSLTTAFSHTVNSLEYNTLMATPASYATHAPLASILAPSSNVIMSHSSEAVTSSSQSLFLPPSHTPPGSSPIVSITDMLSVPYVSTSSSHTLDITSFSSNVLSPSQTSAAKLEVSSSQYVSNSGYPSLVVTSFLPSTISLSSPASTSKHVSSLSTSTSISLAVTDPSSHASAGTLDSSKATFSSKSMSSSASPSLAIISLLPLSLTSHSITDTDAFSGRMSASDIVSSSASPTLEMSTIHSSKILSLQVGAGTYASSVGVSSSVSASSSVSLSFAVTGLPSSMISSQVLNGMSSMTMSSSVSASSSASSISAGVVLHSITMSSAQLSPVEYSSSFGASSLELQSRSASPTLSMTPVPSSMPSSAQASASEYSSSVEAPSSHLQSSSASSTLSISPVPSSMTSSLHASTGTYASPRGVSSSASYPSSLSAVFSTTIVPSSTISSSQASASNFASLIGLSPSVSASNSASYISASVALHSIMMSSAQAGTGEYSSSWEASLSELQSTTESLSPLMTSSIISTSQVSAGTYTSSRGESAFALVLSSASPTLEMNTIHSSIILSSQVGAGTYACSMGVSSSVSASSSVSLSFAVTGLPSCMISSQTNVGTSSKGMSSYVTASSSASYISANVALHSIMTSSAQASASEYSSSKDASSLELQSRSASPTLSMTPVPSSMTSSARASASEYSSSMDSSSLELQSKSASHSLSMSPVPSSMTSSSLAGASEYSSSMDASSLELQSSSASLTMSVTAVPNSLTSSVQASTKAYSSSMEASSSDQQLISASPTLSMAAVPSGMASSSHASAGGFASSRVMLFASVSSSPSPTSMHVPSSSVSLVFNPLPSQSSVSQILSSRHTESPFALNSISLTSHLPNPTTTLTSLSAAIATSPQPTAITILPSAPALLSDIVSHPSSYVISPTSSLLSPGQSSAIPGTYKQEPTTEGTTVTTTVPDVAPYISNPSQNLNGHFGENVILTCDVGGFPEPSVSWFYDQKKIFNAYAVDNNLTLTYVTKDNDGDYTCVAVNSVGAANGTIHFKIYNPITVKNPVVILDTDNLINQLECAAKGDPVPKITWTKYGGGLDISTDYSISAFEDGDLLLTGLSKANLHTYQGIYICHADNGAKDAYVVAAGNITQTQDNSQTFNDVGMNVGAAFHAMCVPGTVDADGSSLSTTFGANDSICDSARRVGVLAKDAGPVTWFIRTDGKAEFVTEAEGGAFSSYVKNVILNDTLIFDDVQTAQDAPMPQLPSTITAVKAPLSCETCSGPTCGMLPGRDTQCPRMTPFCMNTITTRTGGSKSVTKSCASVNDCETKWWQLTSDEDKCMTPVPGNPESEDFTCSYCCTESGCNKDGVPKKDTLYKGNRVHSQDGDALIFH